MDNKLKELRKYSNPTKVKNKIKKELGIDVLPSTRDKKKYMVKSPDDKWIHFGEMGYEDFTKHNDKERRENFLARNARWKNAPIYTPRYLSYHFLW
jgi:hypothetical protein